VAVLFLGEQTYTEKPGDIEDLSLEPAQLDLVRAVAATGTPVVAVFLAGRPRTFDAVEPLLDAVVMAYLPGDAGGEAIVGLLAGDFNPRGRLPFTWPRHPSSHTPYDHKYTDRIHTDFSETAHKPQYPYGYGLGYTSAEVLSLTTDRAIYRTEDTVRVTVEVGAAGGAADEVLFVFSSDSVASGGAARGVAPGAGAGGREGSRTVRRARAAVGLCGPRPVVVG
jgi:beta-glucosidase